MTRVLGLATLLAGHCIEIDRFPSGGAETQAHSLRSRNRSPCRHGPQAHPGRRPDPASRQLGCVPHRPCRRGPAAALHQAGRLSFGPLAGLSKGSLADQASRGIGSLSLSGRPAAIQNGELFCWPSEGHRFLGDRTRNPRHHPWSPVTGPWESAQLVASPQHGRSVRSLEPALCGEFHR